MPFHLSFHTIADFLFPPSPSGSAPPRRVRVTRTDILHFRSHQFNFSILLRFSSLSATSTPSRTSKKVSMIHDPHVFLFAIHRQRPRYFSPVPSDFPQFPLHIPSAHHISYILFLLFFFSFFICLNVTAQTVCDSVSTTYLCSVLQ